jgi:death-on-curing protein
VAGQPPAPEPVWVSRLVADAIHFDQLREHGGLSGIRDENALEAALARPRQRWQYEPTTDVSGLAAAYGWGLATSHPYWDGNKRTAFVAMVVFLGLNGIDLEATQGEVVTTMLAVASGGVTEAELERWVRAHVTRAAE